MTEFETFGTGHLITIALIFAISIIVPLIYKNKSETHIKILKNIIIFVLASHLIISPFKDLYLLENPYNWKEVLPFHMCDISEIFLIWFLLGGPRFLYLCAFFWGLAGAAMAIITPDIQYYDLDFIFFMVGHGMIIFAVLFATIVLKNRPKLKDVGNVVLVTLFLFLPNIYLINDLLGDPANFWYLADKPAGASLMDFFPEPPRHLFITVPISIIFFYIIYTPYLIKDIFIKNNG